MDQKNNGSSKTTAKVFTLIALFIVLLTHLLIKMFSSPSTTNYAHSTVALPKLKKPAVVKVKEDEWKIITTQSGDSLASIFKHAGLSRQTLQAILSNNKHAKTLANIKPNQEIRLLIHNDDLEKLIFATTATQSLVVSRQNNHFVTTLETRQMTSQNSYLTATVRGSLYGTAKRMNIPYKLIQQMTDIFKGEINFAKDIRAGDQFSIAYKAYFVEDKLVDAGEILAVSYTNRGKPHQAVRYAKRGGDYDYYTPQGNSLQKAFIRYPVKFSHISSTYSLSRYHPILHYNRPHKGVDLAASIGTPVHATGDGRIAIIDHQSGYGNMVKLTHDQGYASVYAHLLRFQKGLSKGDRVKRGQVIGYVGQSGLADGPHCHYEFHINQQPKNPSTIELPHAAPIPAREMAHFKSNTSTILAQLKLYEEASLADARGKKATNTA